MPDERLRKKILYGELQVGKRSHGARKRYKDTRKASLKDFNIPTESWEQIAQDRAKWRGLIRRDAGEYEAKRISKPEQKCAQRKARAKTSPTELSSSDLFCTVCNRQFELRLVSSAVSEHTNNNTSCICLGLVIVSNDKRTNRGAENRGFHIYIEKVQTINARVIVVVVGWVGWCVRACVCVYVCVFFLIVYYNVCDLGVHTL